MVRIGAENKQQTLARFAANEEYRILAVSKMEAPNLRRKHLARWWLRCDGREKVFER